MQHRLAVVCAALILASCADGTTVDPGVRTGVDGGAPMDLSSADLGPADLGAVDLGPTDLGVVDLGTVDLGAVDLGPVDLGRDLGPVDLGHCVDADGDGHGALSCGGDDCDDANNQRYPGALERCQGVDDNCNGAIDEGSFTASFIGAGDTTWRNYELDCASTAAPTTPIQTVIDIESLARAYFFTATTYHVLNLLTRTWIASGARNTLMPQAAGVTLIAGYTVPAGWAGSSTTVEGMVVVSNTNVYGYEIDISIPSSPVFRFGVPASGDTNPRPWTPPSGTQTLYVDVSGSWAPDARAACMLTTPTPTMGPYSAWFTATRALIDDAGWCFLRIEDVPIASFGPFAYAGAPARTAWRHAVFNVGLWVFAAPRY